MWDRAFWNIITNFHQRGLPTKIKINALGHFHISSTLGFPHWLQTALTPWFLLSFPNTMAYMYMPISVCCLLQFQSPEMHMVTWLCKLSFSFSYHSIAMTLISRNVKWNRACMLKTMCNVYSSKIFVAYRWNGNGNQYGFQISHWFYFYKWRTNKPLQNSMSKVLHQHKLLKGVINALIKSRFIRRCFF